MDLGSIFLKVATCTIRAGGHVMDDHDVMRRSRLGTGMMMDGVGDYKEAWLGAMARAEKVDRVMEGRKKTRQYINAGDL